MKKTRCLLLVIILLLTPSLSNADLGQHQTKLGGGIHPDDVEITYLPPYCRCRIALHRDRYKSEKEKWGRIFTKYNKANEGWVGLHHYCFGLLYLSRLSRGLGERAYLLKNAESEIGYVIRHSSQTFILMPEIYSKMGEIKKLQNEYLSAQKHFLTAIKLKPDYVPAYIHLINLHLQRNDWDAALKMARKGLKHSPNSKPLNNKLAEVELLKQQ